MNMPGFSAEVSLYVSRNHYSTTGAVIQVEADVFPISLEIPLEVPIANTFINFQEGWEGTSASGNVAHHREAFAADTKRAVVPMSVPAHHSNLADSSQCSDCLTDCDLGGDACEIGALVACSPLFDVPFVGPALWGICSAIGALFCSANKSTCKSNCFNIGSPCCPVACGYSCCDRSEMCSDTGQGLCCSAGTKPCGDICCVGDEVCAGGICCRPGDPTCMVIQ